MLLEEAVYRDLTDEEFKTLSPEEQLIWILRPKDELIRNAKIAMMIRSLLIAASGIYWFIRYDYLVSDLIFPIIFILFAYEFAYYSLKSEKLKQEYAFAHEEYLNKIKNIRLNS